MVREDAPARAAGAIAPAAPSGPGRIAPNGERMAAGRDTAATRAGATRAGATRAGGWDWLVLGAVVALGVAQTADVREAARVAAGFAPLVRTDEDFHRSPAGLGAEYAVVESLRRERPPGTRVALPGDSTLDASRKRFWLALLPEYPIAGDAALVICERPCARPGDALLGRGDRFELRERTGRDR